MEDETPQESVTEAAGRFTDDGKTFFGKAFFAYPKGDEYEGSFKAVVDGQVFRNGAGVYVTRDDEIYEGTWDDDVLKNVVIIKYPDGSSFSGNVDSALKYSGFGSFTFPDTSSMYCNFTGNYPRGPVYVNSGNHIWGGNAERSCAYLLPVNRFLPTESTLAADDA